MSNFGQIPSSSTISAPKTNRSNKDSIVKILRLPNDLQNNSKATKISGTITKSDNNGSARIQTDRGFIDVQFPKNGADKAPKEGQRLEITIPAGKPPKQASVQRQAPENTSQSQQTQNREVPQTQPRSSRPTNTATNLPPNNTATRGQVTNTQATQQQITQQTIKQATANTSAQTAPLTQGTNVRLIAVPPNQAIQIAQQSLSTLTIQNNLITSTAFTANLIAQNIKSQIATNVLNITPEINISSATQTQNLTPVILKPITSNTAQPPVNNTFFQPGNNENIINTSTINNILGSITTFKPNASIIPTSKLNGANIGKIDVQILQISQANVNLTAPTIDSVSNSNQTKIPALTQFTPAIISSNSAATITAQVTGMTNQGQPLVTLKLPNAPLPQSFILQYTPNNIAIGSQIKLTIQNTSIIPAPSTSATQPVALNNLLQGFSWGAFDDALQALQQNSPRLAASLIRSLPNAGNPSQLGAVGAIAMAAIKGGDLSLLLGDKKIDAIQRLTKGGTISRLTQDTASAPRTESNSNADWRAVPLPMFWDGEIHKITLFMRKENQEQSQQEQNEGSSRFIFDLNLSRMGEVQLDGYLNDKRLDLIVRTQSGFSKPMQQTMRVAYSNAIKQANMSGDLTFQGHNNNWVNVLQENEKLGVSV